MSRNKGDNVLMAPPIVFRGSAVRQLMYPYEKVGHPLVFNERRIAWHLAKCEGEGVAAVLVINTKNRTLEFSQNRTIAYSDSYLVVDFTLRVALASLRKAPTGEHVVYRHYPTITSPPDTVLHWADPQTNLANDGVKSYVGVTGRDWLTRFKEHEEASRTGSKLLFHTALRRGMTDVCTTGCAGVDILALGLTKDEAYALEAKYIAELSLYPMGYNMVPGGKAGHQLIDRFLPGRTTSENREQRLAELVTSRENPFKHLTDEEWASVMTRIVCNNPNNFSVAEIREINLLATIGWADSDIADRLGVHERRITQVVSGRTYKMVRL